MFFCWTSNCGNISLCRWALFTHTSIPKLPAPKVPPPLTQHVLYTSLTVTFRAKQETFYTNQKQRSVWVESLRLYLKGKKEYDGELRMGTSQGRFHCNFWDQSVGWNCLVPHRDSCWVRISFSACWITILSNFHWWIELGSDCFKFSLNAAASSRGHDHLKTGISRSGGLFLNYNKGFNSLTLLEHAPDQGNQATLRYSGLFSGILLTGHQLVMYKREVTFYLISLLWTLTSSKP